MAIPRTRRCLSVSNARLAKATASVVLATFIACAAQQRPTEMSPAPLFSSQQLDQTLAPIALYPDPLVAEILTAATYPLEVVEADRWLQVPANASLQGDQLVDALEQQSWAPSVKSLVPFPLILKTMDDNLEWTEKLGDAFLAQQADVMDSVQRLRRAAEGAGALAPTEQEMVTTEHYMIIVEPASPAVVYVPCYNPALVYGVWPWPGHPPYFWPCEGFWLGFPVVHRLWGWHHWRWRHHQLGVDAARFNAINVHHPPVTSDVWQHDPLHRDGVPYRDAATRARFQGSVSPQARLASRGYPVGAPAQGAVHAPPVFESFGQGREVRAYSERGAGSMRSFGGGARGFGAGRGGRR